MPRQSPPRKPTLRKPRVRKKAVRTRKATKRKVTARKPVLRKATKRKVTARKPVLRKATKRKVTARKPAKLNDRMDRVEATLDRLATAHEKGMAELAETRAGLAETRAGLAETRAGLAETIVGLGETRAGLAETRIVVAETTAGLARLGVEVDKTVASVHELRKSIGGLDEKWGDFSEALLVGDVEVVLNNYDGIEVTERHMNVDVVYQGKKWEIDCLLVGPEMVVAIEAKSSLKEGHVGKFIGNIMEQFTEMMPTYRGKKIYGAIGYLNAKDKTVAFAQSKGLIVLRSVHKNKEIVSMPSKFKLRNFHP